MNKSKTLILTLALCFSIGLTAAPSVFASDSHSKNDSYFDRFDFRNFRFDNFHFNFQAFNKHDNHDDHDRNDHHDNDHNNHDNHDDHHDNGNHNGNDNGHKNDCEKHPENPNCTVSVPEFGVLPSAVAAIASVGSFLALKRKKN